MVTGLPYEREPWNVFAVNEEGEPTTYLSFMILKTMFSEPYRWFTPKELGKLLVAKYTDVDSICCQLKQVDLLSKNASQHGHYRYNLNTTNVDLQTGFEKFLVDVELENLPVHLTLDYSPSFRSPGYL